jgi:hypothetical protein
VVQGAGEKSEGEAGSGGAIIANEKALIYIIRLN